MGYYEALDYTKERLAPTAARDRPDLHGAPYGMSLVALNNALNENIMQTRFHGDPRVQAAELLLQERSPHLVPLDRPRRAPRRGNAGSRRAVARAQVCNGAYGHPRAHLLSNGSLTVMLTNAGGGYTLARRGRHPMAGRFNV